MPLRALLDGEDFFSWNLTEDDRTLPFKCPICDDNMIPVLPQQDIIKHFRHKNEEAHGEPETPEHLEMKNAIYNSLTCNEPDPDIKIENPVGFRIADVIMIDFGLVIECQCSSISIEEMMSREKDYNESGYYVLWVFGGSFYENTRKYELWERRNNIYRIQKLSAPERYVLDNQLLIYYNKNHFYFGSFKFRSKGRYEKCKTLGWYQLQRYNPEYFYWWVNDNIHGATDWTKISDTR